MNVVYEYSTVYVLSGMIGWLTEHLYTGKDADMCGDTINKKYLHICIPFLHVWAFCGILLFFMMRNCDNINKMLLAIFAGILITAIEGTIGIMSYNINGYMTWNYNDHLLPMFGGYCALDIMLCWIIIAYLFISFCPIK